MDFYDFATTHDLSRRAGLTNETPAAFYRQLQAAAYVERARGVEGMTVEFNRYASELKWWLAGRPYYKLWPGVTGRLHHKSVADQHFFEVVLVPSSDETFILDADLLA